MKKFYKIIIISVSIVMLAFILAYLYFFSPIMFFVQYDPKNIIDSYSSPNEKNVISFYLKNGGSLSYDSVVGTYSDSGKDEVKFFFEYPCNNVTIKKWYDDDTVLLEWYNPQIGKNKKLKINIKESVHHFRKNL